MRQVVRWGVWSTGSIAHRFMNCARLSASSQFIAVGSRQQAKARAFAEEYGIARAYEGLDAMLENPDIDLIYIGSPHSAHCADTLKALDAGKHVLCEKPFAVNAAEAAAMIAKARARKRFLMEAMWTRLFPANIEIRERLRTGDAGDIRVVQANMSFATNAGPGSRLLDPKLAGGALLDVGIYVLSYASMAFGGAEPSAVSGAMNRGETGVDVQDVLTLKYPCGGLAQLCCGLSVRMPTRAEIFGTKALIAVPDFYHPKSYTFAPHGQEPTEARFPYEKEGFQYEMDHVSACVRDGLLESPAMPLQETLALAKTMDRLREQWGLRYPFE